MADTTSNFTSFICVPCTRTSTAKPFCAVDCEDCGQLMVRGSFCLGCEVNPATHDDLCLDCTALQVFNGLCAVDELPEAWRADVATGVEQWRAYQAREADKRREQSRAEMLELLAMVARAPAYIDPTLPSLLRRQAV